MIIIPHKLSGRIKLSAMKADKSIRELTPWFHNLVLNGGLDLIAASSNWLDFCHVGLDGTAEDSTQTSLLSPLVATSNRTAAVNTVMSATPYGGISTITYTFAIGAASGIIRELGFGPSGTLGDPLFNRSLVEDQFGNDSFTIVNSDEALIVQYELTLLAPAQDITGTILIDGVAVNYTARAANVDDPGTWCPYRAESFANPGQAVQTVFNTTPGQQVIAFDGSMGNVLGVPSGNSANAVFLTTVPYLTGNYQSFVRAEWDMGAANFVGGIKSLYWAFNLITGTGGNSFGAYQIEFATPIAKTNQQSIRFDLGISWSRG